MIVILTLAFNTLLLGRLVAAQTCTPCDDVHLFLARGNNEPYPGRQGDLVAAVCDGVASCGYEDLIYSALYTDLSCQTTYDGCIAGKTQLTAYADRCPNSKLILTGYSQGAQIVLDILGGGGGVSFNGCVQPNTTPLDRNTSPGNRIAAVLAVGNTRHTANQPYNYGNGSAIDGLFPKSGAELADILPYANITRDFCLSTDPICAANQTVSYVSTHLGYYNRSVQDFAAWIKQTANITNDDPSFHTAIPTYVSGTVQDYATVGTATPSGTVKTTSVTTASVSCSNVPSSGASSTAGSSSGSAGATSSATSGSTPQKATAAITSAAATAQSSKSASSGVSQQAVLDFSLVAALGSLVALFMQ